MRYHDFHLNGYTVSKFGDEIVLHLIYDYPPRPVEQSHVQFTSVALYHFVHTGGSIICDIAQVPISQVLDQSWDRIREWSRLHGGLPYWDDDRLKYQAKLELEGCRAWAISSSIGFSGFVIAKSIEDVTQRYPQTA